ncbi:hypothetical protein PL9631_1060409 [Planktothrix paucivesiculata PCC 9631]|uniref:Uncharacterized protein n=1 Tax=Planktothrix paucivesiculata PCC 9631 TaxID=671071 RepID=A0A7Z9DYJ2_9CYAN|nr:hypothetical protein PL9631_1060409 [Planktothrix paucivesiculata PCC 9631]
MFGESRCPARSGNQANEKSANLLDRPAYYLLLLLYIKSIVSLLYQQFYTLTWTIMKEI